MARLWVPAEYQLQTCDLRQSPLPTFLRHLERRVSPPLHLRPRGLPNPERRQDQHNDRPVGGEASQGRQDVRHSWSTSTETQEESAGMEGAFAISLRKAEKQHQNFTHILRGFPWSESLYMNQFPPQILLSCILMIPANHPTQPRGDNYSPTTCHFNKNAILFSNKSNQGSK